MRKTEFKVLLICLSIEIWFIYCEGRGLIDNWTIFALRPKGRQQLSDFHRGRVIDSNNISNRSRVYACILVQNNRSRKNVRVGTERSIAIIGFLSRSKIRIDSNHSRNRVLDTYVRAKEDYRQLAKSFLSRPKRSMAIKLPSAIRKLVTILPSNPFFNAYFIHKWIKNEPSSLVLDNRKQYETDVLSDHALREKERLFQTDFIQLSTTDHLFSASHPISQSIRKRSRQSSLLRFVFVDAERQCSSVSLSPSSKVRRQRRDRQRRKWKRGFVCRFQSGKTVRDQKKYSNMSRNLWIRIRRRNR